MDFFTFGQMGHRVSEVDLVLIKQTNEGQFLNNKFIRFSKRNEAFSGSVKMNQKHNANMRRHHIIQQPGFDVQRFGHK